MSFFMIRVSAFRPFVRGGFGLICAFAVLPVCSGQEPTVAVAENQAEESDSTRQADEVDLAKLLTGSRWLGQFTSQGKDGQTGAAKKESYEILKAEKLPDGDLWMLQARIKYNKRDVAVPLPIEILWAGRTAVITVDQLTIPGMGTFDARVLIRKGKYAGTWAHNDHGGHLFGTIGRLEPKE